MIGAQFTAFEHSLASYQRRYAPVVYDTLSTWNEYYDSLPIVDTLLDMVVRDSSVVVEGKVADDISVFVDASPKELMNADYSVSAVLHGDSFTWWYNSTFQTQENYITFSISSDLVLKQFPQWPLGNGVSGDDSADDGAGTDAIDIR